LVVTPVADIVKAYDRGFDDLTAAEGELLWSEEGALRLVHRHLQTEKPQDGEVWFDDEVDYLYEGVVARERIREAAENYRSIWPQCWQFLQEPPKVTSTAEGAFEVRVNYVHLALDTRRLRKWQWERCYHIREADGGNPIITTFLNEEVRKTLPLTDAERRFLLGHFCQNYYDAGCATSDVSQLVFLYDPTYYIDEDHTLNEISQSLEHYHSIRPKRQLSLKAMSDIECLEEDLYLIVCLFEAKRDVGYDPVVITDIMQVRFFDDEPHVVYVKPRP